MLRVPAMKRTNLLQPAFLANLRRPHIHVRWTTVLSVLANRYLSGTPVKTPGGTSVAGSSTNCVPIAFFSSP